MNRNSARSGLFTPIVYTWTPEFFRLLAGFVMEYVFDFPSDAETSNLLYQHVPDNLLYVHPSSYRAMEIYIHTLY